MNVLVTGATGFIGAALVSILPSKEGFEPVAVVRRQQPDPPAIIQTVQVGDLNTDTNWGLALKNIQVVVHAAARVHVMKDTKTDPLGEYRKSNVAGTLNLARQAIDSGVKRLIFISSIKYIYSSLDKYIYLS